MVLQVSSKEAKQIYLLRFYMNIIFTSYILLNFCNKKTDLIRPINLMIFYVTKNNYTVQMYNALLSHTSGNEYPNILFCSLCVIATSMIWFKAVNIE